MAVDGDSFNFLSAFNFDFGLNTSFDDWFDDLFDMGRFSVTGLEDSFDVLAANGMVGSTPLEVTSAKSLSGKTRGHIYVPSL